LEVRSLPSHSLSVLRKQRSAVSVYRDDLRRRSSSKMWFIDSFDNCRHCFQIADFYSRYPLHSFKNVNLKNS
jgi:hypothetical protein